MKPTHLDLLKTSRINPKVGRTVVKDDPKLSMGLNSTIESVQTELSLGSSASRNCSSRCLDEANFSSVLSKDHFSATYTQNIEENATESFVNFECQGASVSCADGAFSGIRMQPRHVANVSSGDTDDLHRILSNDVLGNAHCGAAASMLDEGSTNAAKRVKLANRGICGLMAVPERFQCSVVQTEEEFRKADDAGSSRLALQSVVCNVSSVGGQAASSILSRKICRFLRCGKHARGASGLCITHGGGRRCQKPNCTKGAESRTNFCKTHGGGPRCQSLGCLKSAEGKTDFCIAHGGGRRCSVEDCTKAARGKSGKCIRHGGGKRCQRDGCTKSAEGISGLCISHGGGKRCQFLGCGKGAQGSTMFCKGHGGGKRCVFEGCTKGAEGSTLLCKAHGGGKRCTFAGCPKSVHGATLFCVAHGGGKRCSFAGCTKSARGRTDFCVRHGGGKRCNFQGCSKSAQGSTDFCKAHGSGKMCVGGSSKKSPVRPSSPDGIVSPDETTYSLCNAHGTSLQARQSQVAMLMGKNPEWKHYNPASEGMEIHHNRTAVSESCDAYQEMVCPGHQLLVDKIQMAHIAMDGAPGNPSTVSLEQRVHGGSLLAHFAKDGTTQLSAAGFKKWQES